MARRTKSALKRQRQTPRRRVRNLTYVSRMRTIIKKFLQAAGTPEAPALYAAAQKAIDKAAEAGAIHRNAASRRKARLAKRVRGEAQPA